MDYLSLNVISIPYIYIDIVDKYFKNFFGYFVYGHIYKYMVTYTYQNKGRHSRKGIDMILYKNVDIKDLESILDKGILSLNESVNNNWDDGKRADNSCDVVYLFQPLAEQNSFCNYGTVLLETNIPDDKVKGNEMRETDVNRNNYIEFITDNVAPEYIKAIYIPNIFKDRIELPSEIASRITWCDMKANYYGSAGKENCPDEVLELFAKTADIMDASTYNFFRGVTENREMIDLYDIQYII